MVSTQFIFSAGLIVAVVLWGLLSPASLDRVFGDLLVSITHNFGWFYLWVVWGLVVLAVFLAVSRYGELKLGDEDDEPEFSVGAWFSMLFAAGMGIGLVFWGVAEPVSHYVNSPPGVAPGTPEAANIAMPPIHRWHRVGADVGGLRVVLDFWRCGPLHGNFSGCSGRGRRQGRCVYRHVCLVQCAAHGGGDVGGNPNPPNRVKVMWGVLAGGLKAMQTATIVFALPFSLVLLLMAFSVTRAIHQDWTADQRLEKALRKKVRELVK